MTDPFDFQRRTFPSRVADLGFAVDVPGDWSAHDLPESDDDFSDPTLFLPLALLTSATAPIVLAIAARPAYDDGAVYDWATYLLQNERMETRAIGMGQLGASMAVVGEAMQRSEIGPMIVRFAFAEDGGRLINVTLSAPAQIADAAVPVWQRLVGSFELEAPRGGTVALHPDLPPPHQAAPEPAPAPDAADEPNVTEYADDSPPDGEDVLATFAQFALDDTPATLDPEHPTMVNLRERGIGFSARVLATNDDERRATVIASGIMARFDVPYGWHVIDDGRRALLLDPSNAVQINLSLFPREGRSDRDLVREIAEQVRADYPNPSLLEISGDGMVALGVRDIAVDGEAIEQMHIFVPAGDDDTALRARVTSSPERMVGAANLAELILRSTSFDLTSMMAPPRADDGATAPAEEPEDQSQPAWWRNAKRLERENRLEEAEKAITDALQHIGAPSSVAQLYAERLDRLASAGDRAGAAESYKKAREWITYYASLATSGGEGAALSMERDEFLDDLAQRYPDIAH